MSNKKIYETRKHCGPIQMVILFEIMNMHTSFKEYLLVHIRIINSVNQQEINNHIIPSILVCESIKIWVALCCKSDSNCIYLMPLNRRYLQQTV